MKKGMWLLTVALVVVFVFSFGAQSFAQEPVEPVAEPAVEEPVAETPEEQPAEPVEEPIAEPQPVAEAPTEPVAEPTAEPAEEPVVESADEVTGDIILDPSLMPAVDEMQAQAEEEALLLEEGLGLGGELEPKPESADTGFDGYSAMANGMPTGAFANLPELANMYLPSNAYDNWNWAVPDRIYYYAGSNGNLNVVVVDTTNKQLKIFTYDDARKLVGSKKVSYSDYPIFGGFYAAPDGNLYVAVGQSNDEENDTKTVIVIRKYNKSWSLLGQGTVRGGITQSYFKGISSPFKAGACSMALVGSKLVVHASRQMYTYTDGLRHQSNLTFEVNTSNMVATLLDSGRANTIYSSHSFNQFVRESGGTAAFLDHGDAYPRAVSLKIAPNYASGSSATETYLFNLQGTSGANYTGTTVTGFEAGTNGYLVTGNSVPHGNAVGGVTGIDSGWSYIRNIYLISANKSTGAPRFNWITTYKPTASGTTVSEPRMVKLGDDRFALLFTVTKGTTPQMEYRLVNSSGKVLASKTFAGMVFNPISDPLVSGKRISWAGNGYLGSSSQDKYYLYELDITDAAAPIVRMLPTQSVRLNKTSANVNVGANLALSATVSPASASKKLKWTSSKTSVAIVSSSGQVRGVAPGSAVITATATDGTGKKATCNVTVALGRPGTVKTTSVNYRVVKLNWSKVSGASGYEVYHSKARTSGFTLAATVTGGSNVTHSRGSLVTGRTYYYKIRAFQTIAGKKVYGGFSTVASGKAVPYAPAKVAAAAKGKGSIVLKWSGVTGATGYEVWISATSTGGYSLVKKVPGSSAASFTDSGREAGKTYYYKIRGYRVASNGAVTYGNYSAATAVRAV